MTLAAMIPVADMDAANATLEAAGWGPNNFSVPTYTGPGTGTHGVLHTWDIPGFLDDIKAIPNVVVDEAAATPTAKVDTVVATVSGGWGGSAPVLEGVVTPGLYNDPAEDLKYWWVIQQYDTAQWPDPEAVPALVREARIPGEITVWKQPTDQFDAYKLVEPFTGEPEYVTHNGATWFVSQADGAGNNTSEPGVFGWTEVT